MLYKHARVEYQPMGVLGAIIPYERRSTGACHSASSWNYPFHNMLGQLISALFAGNAIVIKVSEHACWSAAAYQTCRLSRVQVVRVLRKYRQGGAAQPGPLARTGAPPTTAMTA